MSASAAVAPRETVRLGPQAGPQTAFLGSAADIAIYGGAAGGGKTYALLLDPLRHYQNGDFGGVIFRKTSVQVRNEGGLWDESMKLYPLLGGKPKSQDLSWRFESNMSMSFAYLEHANDILNWQGSQLAWSGWDELTHFSEHQFFYMLSRMRTLSGVKTRVRATCNPDPDSWVRKFIDWWIGRDGFPIKERSGKLRWFYRVDEKMIWADSPEEIHAVYGRGPEVIPRSVTFIAAKVEDNKILLEKNPEYLGNLLAMARVDRLRLHGGNWNVRASAGTLFRREWFKIVDAPPAGAIQSLRYWDRAATEVSEANKDPDWTQGVKLLKYADGRYLVADIKSLQGTPGAVEDLVKNVASHDGITTMIRGEQDPGSAGVADAQAFVTMLAGYMVSTCKPTKDKVTRAKPVSAQCEVGNIMVLRAPWNEGFFQELENFPDGGHDDQVDAFSGAFNELSATGLSLADV